jgi:hypothetical protein
LTSPGAAEADPADPEPSPHCAAPAASMLWDQETFRAIVARQVELARTAGALERLPVALVRQATGDTWRGDLAEVEALVAGPELRPAGSRFAPRGGSRQRRQLGVAKLHIV